MILHEYKLELVVILSIWGSLVLVSEVRGWLDSFDTENFCSFLSFAVILQAVRFFTLYCKTAN
jgi:hypothetical protein